MLRPSAKDRLSLLERAAAAGIGAPVEDTLWLVQQVRQAHELISSTDSLFRTLGKKLRDANHVVGECRQVLEGEAGK